MSKVENLISQSGLSDDKQLALKQSFVDFERISNFWQEQAEKIIVTDINDTDMMVLAKEGRKALSDKRIAIEKLRKKLKDASLQEGRMIDTIAKELTGLITPTEEYLKLQETFAQRMEEKRIAQLVEDRNKAFAPYGVDTRFYDFATMDEIMFETLLLGAKTKFEKEEEDKRLLEEARLKKIEEEKIKAEEQRLENIRLKALAEEQAKKLKELKEEEEKKAKEIERVETELRLEKERSEQTRLEVDRLQSNIWSGTSSVASPSPFINVNGQDNSTQVDQTIEIQKQQVELPMDNIVFISQQLPPNTIIIGECIKIDSKYFYYNGEKIEDINNVYQLFTDYLKNNK
jgi:hypothetical protein